MKKVFQETIFYKSKKRLGRFSTSVGDGPQPPAPQNRWGSGWGVPQGPTYAGWRTPSAPIDVPILLTFFYLSKYLTISSSVSVQTQKSIKKAQRTRKEMKELGKKKTETFWNIFPALFSM